MNVYEEHKEVLRITLRRVLLLYLNEKKLIFFFYYANVIMFRKRQISHISSCLIVFSELHFYV